MGITLSKIKLGKAIGQLPVMLLAVPQNVSGLIVDVLEEFYTDGIDEVESAKLDGDAIVGTFNDKVGLRQVKRYRYRIADDSVSYKALNADEVENFSIQFAAKKKRKKRNCVKGTPCGGSCISATKTCRKKPSAASKKKIDQTKQALGGGGQQLDKKAHRFYLVGVSDISGSKKHRQTKAFKQKVQDAVDEGSSLGGLRSPMLLRRTGPERYESLTKSSDISLEAAKRMKQSDLKAFEDARAFVIKPEKEQAAIKQEKMLSKIEPEPVPANRTSGYFEVAVSSVSFDLVNTPATKDLASSIDEFGGLLRPVVLERSGPDSYRVVSGSVEMSAAKLAKDIDQKRNEMVSAFVLD